MPNTRVLRCPVCGDAFGPGLRAVPLIRQHMQTAHDWRVYMVLGEDRPGAAITIVATWGTSLPFRQDVRWEDGPKTVLSPALLRDVLSALHVCPDCGAERPDDDRVASGMRCSFCAYPRFGLDRPHQEGVY